MLLLLVLQCAFAVVTVAAFLAFLMIDVIVGVAYFLFFFFFFFFFFSLRFVTLYIYICSDQFLTSSTTLL